MKLNIFLKLLEIVLHLSLHVGPFFTCYEQPTFTITAEIFLHLVIDAWHLCQLSTSAIISSCFAFLAYMKARIPTYSQFTCWGFLACTSTVESDFWFITRFLAFCFFLCGSTSRSLVGCNLRVNYQKTILRTYMNQCLYESICVFYVFLGWIWIQ
jgi:hypothetical protein